MAIVSISETINYDYARDVTEKFFGTVVKTGKSSFDAFGTGSTQNGLLLQGQTNTNLAYDYLNIGSIRFPGGTESRIFDISGPQDIAGLHRAIDYCAANNLSLNFTLHDAGYIKSVEPFSVFLSTEERAELTRFIQTDLLGYAGARGVQVESIHIGNEFQGRVEEYGNPAWAGYAKASAVLINELDAIIDDIPTLPTGRPDFVIQPNNWQSQSDQAEFTRILSQELGIDGVSAAEKVDAIDVHGTGTGNRTTTNTLELTWEDYFGTGDAASYEENLSRKTDYWRSDERFSDIGFRNDAWAYATSPKLSDAPLAMLQLHAASELGFESVTNYVGYDTDASALIRKSADQTSTMLNVTTGAALFAMMSQTLQGTKAVELASTPSPEQEALDPLLIRAFAGDNRSVLYMVNRTDADIDVDLVTSGFTAGSEAFLGGVKTVSVTVLGSTDPTNGQGVPTLENLTLSVGDLTAAKADFKLNSYEIAQINMTANGKFGTDASDVMSISAQNEVLHGLDGDDSLLGSAGNNSLAGGQGNDTLFGGAGNDIVFGGAGRDVLVGGGGTDSASYLFADDGLSINLATPSKNTGDALGDVYVTIENIIGGDYNDTITGDAAKNELYGGNGNDSFYESTGGDSYFGGSGLGDGLYTDKSHTFISLHGGTNNKGMILNNIENLFGNMGNDTLTGNAAKNTISGNAGNDTISGYGNDDFLSGNLGNDTLIGGRGNDTLAGGPGVDLLTGGEGADAYLYYTPGEGGDFISDFNYASSENDVIMVRAISFGKLAVGQLSEDNFALRDDDNLAQDADDRFIYRKSDSTLWFDLDGTGRLSAQLLAQLDDQNPNEEIALSASHVWIF